MSPSARASSQGNMARPYSASTSDKVLNSNKRNNSRLPGPVATNGENVAVMKLNVGGTFFTTTKATMCAVPGTYLHRIATGAQACPRDERGNFVIDRDGHVFRYVINFLRTSKLIVPQGFRELDILKEEGVYYGLQRLVAEIDRIIDQRKRRARGRRWNGAAKNLSASVGEGLNKLTLTLPPGDDSEADYFEDSYWD